MSTVTRNPTANESPDTGQGGDAVTDASNTGHGATESAATDGNGESKTCRWSGFVAVAGPVTAASLKAGWAETGALTGVGASNAFTLAYSLNGGSNWTNFFQHTSITAASSGTAEVALSTAQNLTQVQVRDAVAADTNDAGELAVVQATVSSVRIEVTLADGGLLIMS